MFQMTARQLRKFRDLLIGKQMPPMLDPLTTIPVARARLLKKKCETAPRAGRNTKAETETRLTNVSKLRRRMKRTNAQTHS